MFELVNEYNQNAVIKVIGVGGGGGNAVMSMLESKIHGARIYFSKYRFSGFERCKRSYNDTNWIRDH